MARLNPRAAPVRTKPPLTGVCQYKQQLKATLAMALEEALSKKSVVSACAVIQNWAEREMRDRRFRVTPEDREAVGRLRAEGWSVYAISDRVGLSQPTVRKLLRKTVSKRSGTKSAT